MEGRVLKSDLAHNDLSVVSLPELIDRLAATVGRAVNTFLAGAEIVAEIDRRGERVALPSGAPFPKALLKALRDIAARRLSAEFYGRFDGLPIGGRAGRALALAEQERLASGEKVDLFVVNEGAGGRDPWIRADPLLLASVQVQQLIDVKAGSLRTPEQQRLYLDAKKKSAALEPDPTRESQVGREVFLSAKEWVQIEKQAHRDGSTITEWLRSALKTRT